MHVRDRIGLFHGGLVVVLFGIFCSGVSAEEIAIEQAPFELHAAAVLPEKLLAGPRHQVGPKVTSDGFVNSYDLTTSYGAMTVRSTGLLEERINEVNALYLMEELKNTDVFKNALKETAKGPLKTAKGLVTEPVDTVTGTVKGVGKWFSDVGRSVFSGDPDQEGVAKTALGQAPAKRLFAYEFGIDPYSKWEPVQERLNEIAWAATGGGITVKAAFQLIPESAGYIVRATGTSDGMRKLVRDTSVGELRKINKKKLEAMGVAGEWIEDFLENPYYTPQDRTILVGELESMQGVQDRGLFLKWAVRANSASVAASWRLRAQMLASYALNMAKVSKIVEINGSPLAQREDGVIVGLFPLDYVAWTHELWRKEWDASDRLEKTTGITGKELWISGRVTPSARAALEGKGWKVLEGVGYTPKKR